MLVISRFGFEGWSWILIDSVPSLGIFFTFPIGIVDNATVNSISMKLHISVKHNETTLFLNS